MKKTKPKGDRHHRHRCILMDPTAKAFRGWRNIEADWSLTTCKTFVEWCHIDKLFPYHRHRSHLKQNYANLHYCRDDAFVQRCIEVYRFLYGTPKIPRSEVGLNICQMVYAELKLGRTVDWRTMKASKKITIPTDKDIPRAGPSNNPRDGLGPRKNIKDAVADEDYSWSSSSIQDGSDEEVPLEPMDKMEETPAEESLALVAPTEGNVGDSVAMYVEPLVAVTPVQFSHAPVDEVLQHVHARMRENVEDRLDGEVMTEKTVEPHLMRLPLPRQELDVLPEDSIRRTKKSYKADLKMLLQELEEKDRDCKMLKDQMGDEIECDDVHTLEALIESGQMRLSVQKKEMEELEEFYLKFKKGLDGGSSSTAKPRVEERMKKMIEACIVEETRGNNERRGVEEARSRLNHLEEMKDKGPVDRALDLDAVSVDVQHQTSTVEVEDLKKKLASLTRLEAEFKECMDREKTKLNLRKAFKKFWVRNELSNHTRYHNHLQN